VFPPGEYIRDELEARGWTQADLAFILDRPLQAVNEILTGRKAVTPETASGLADAFGTSPEFWLNLDSAYRLSRVKRSGGEVARRAKLCSLAPVKEMVKRHWITGSADIVALEGELLRFFEVKALEDAPSLSFAARVGVSYTDLAPAHRAWLCRVRKLGRAVSAATFQPQALEQGLADLRQFLASEHDVRRVPRLLADVGVRFVVVEHLPKTRADGAALWLDENTPVVAVSLRFDRIDSFWFTLCHELAHIKNRDNWSVDDALVGEDAEPSVEKPEFERVADQFAAEMLVPNAEIERFIARVRPLYSKRKIIQFANRIKVHPGVVVGQLQRRGEISYSHNRELLAKVRDVVTQAALSDGWGATPPPLP
jgi:HTH-type transcriptional regulator/antitoxin HigA